MDTSRQFLKNYFDIIFGFVFLACSLFFNELHYNITTTFFTVLAVACFAITVSSIADILASRMKEPYSSFVLTFSAIIIEIILLSIFLLEGLSVQSSDSLEIVKTGMITAVIVDINLLLGLSVFVGGLNFKEQSHNESTSSTYTTILFTSAIILLVPSIVGIESDTSIVYKVSVAIAVLMICFYISIFIFQTRTHSHFFSDTAKSRIFLMKRHQKKNGDDTEEEEAEESNYIFEKFSNTANIIIIVFVLMLVAVLSEMFSHNSLVVLDKHNISIGLAALGIAIISVAPEIFTSIKAAKDDEIQRAVNIGMGASTVSILLAMPIVMFIAYMIGVEFTLEFNVFYLAALVVSILLAWKTTEDGETNYFEGISHLVLFAAYIVMIMF